MRAAKAASNEGSGRSKKKLHRMKLIVVGDSCSGKTELVSRWVEERHSGGRYSQTIGVDHHVKRHIIPKQSGNQADSFDLRVNLWELAGADLFLDVRNEFYKVRAHPLTGQKPPISQSYFRTRKGSFCCLISST